MTGRSDDGGRAPEDTPWAGQPWTPPRPPNGSYLDPFEWLVVRTMQDTDEGEGALLAIDRLVALVFDPRPRRKGPSLKRTFVAPGPLGGERPVQRRLAAHELREIDRRWVVDGRRPREEDLCHRWGSVGRLVGIRLKHLDPRGSTCRPLTEAIRALEADDWLPADHVAELRRLASTLATSGSGRAPAVALGLAARALGVPGIAPEESWSAEEQRGSGHDDLVAAAVEGVRQLGQDYAVDPAGVLELLERRARKKPTAPAEARKALRELEDAAGLRSGRLLQVAHLCRLLATEPVIPEYRRRLRAVLEGREPEDLPAGWSKVPPLRLVEKGGGWILCRWEGQVDATSPIRPLAEVTSVRRLNDLPEHIRRAVWEPAWMREGRTPTPAELAAFNAAWAEADAMQRGSLIDRMAFDLRCQMRAVIERIMRRQAEEDDLVLLECPECGPDPAAGVFGLYPAVRSPRLKFCHADCRQRAHA